MSQNELRKWILNFLSSDRFLDWFFMSLLGLLLWLRVPKDGGKRCLLSIPVWSATFYRDKREKMLYFRRYITQMVGLFVVVWSLLLVFITTEHQQRVRLYGIGFLALLILAFLAVVVMESKN